MTEEDPRSTQPPVPPDVASFERRDLPRRAAQARFETAFEEHLRSAFDNSPVGMSIIGLDGRFLRVNAAVCELTRYAPEELIGEHFQRLTHPDDHAADLARFERMCAGELMNYQAEKRYRRGDGQEIWVLLSRSLVTDGEGRPLFFFNVVDDITERRRAEEALAESEERFRSVAEAAGEAIVLADERGMIVSWNTGAQEVFGYRDDEVLGRPLTVLMPERLHDAHWAGIERVRESGRSELAGRLLELVGCRKGGEEFPLELSLASWETRRGRFFSGIIRDVTDRRRAEEALARTTSELERRATELERSNADLQHFAWAASHDLAEPLRVVTGYLELLSSRYRGKLDTQADQFIDYTLTAVERMQALITGLLAYSRVGIDDPVLEEIDSRALVREVLAGLGRSVEDAGATVEVGDLPRVRADPTQLGRVFQNLISNGIKFAGDAPKIRVSAAREESSWRFTVDDNGIGIPPGDRDRIFDMFQRLHSRDSYVGTGLGLAICQRIVERHGGRIWAGDGANGGSAFHFTLPAG